MSTLMHDPIVFEVPPQSADDYALQGSQTGEAILRDKTVKCNWDSRKEELAIATLMGGTAGLCVEWDATAKAYSDELKTGDTVETVLPIVDFVLEPVTREASKARWWIKARILNPETVQSMYNLPKPPPADALTGGPFHQRILPTADTRMNQQQGTLVLTYYERPNTLRPEGSVVVVVDNKIVWGPEKWPFPFKDRLNLEVARCLVVPGKWTGDTFVSSVRPIQTQLNFVWTNIHENTKALGMNKLLIPYGASDIENQLTDDPTQPIRYPDGIEKPSYLAPANVPNHIIRQVEMLENEIADIMGVHGVSQGTAPGGVESGYGIHLLAESDKTPTGRLAYELGRVLGSMATMVLEIYAEKVKDTRQASVMRRGMPVQSVKWRGEHLAGQTTAIVPRDSVLPRNAAADQQFAQTLLQMRADWFPNFATFAQAARLPAEDMMWYMDPDTQKAEYENYRMADGEVIEPEDFDNHTKHIQQHNMFRKTPRYMSMKPELREIFDLHIKAHQSMSAEEAGQQIARQAMHPALGGIPNAQETPPMPNLGMLGALQPQQPTPPAGPGQNGMM